MCAPFERKMMTSNGSNHPINQQRGFIIGGVEMTHVLFANQLVFFAAWLPSKSELEFTRDIGRCRYYVFFFSPMLNRSGMTPLLHILVQ
jgi:hypothetical protein